MRKNKKGGRLGLVRMIAGAIGAARISGISSRFRPLFVAVLLTLPLGLVAGHAEARSKEPAASNARTGAAGAKARTPITQRKAGSAKPAATPRTTKGASRGSAAKRPVSASRSTGAKRASPQRASHIVRVSAPAQAPRLSIGQAIGLHEVYDPLSLRSSVALALDAVTGDVLFEKNAQAVLPIASISKLMTAMVVLDAELSLDDVLEISKADIDTERFSRSRLRPGTQLTRDEMLHLALMSSENRAANALGRHYPGGLQRFVAQMNAKASALGMASSHFVEPTGLSSSNVSSALDLAKLVRAAAAYPLIRAYSTDSSLTVDAGSRALNYRTTNRLVDNSNWEIGLQKTGYISEAGNCLVMQAEVDGRPTVFVLLDASGGQSRFGDAKRLRDWLESSPPRSDGAPRALIQPSRDS